MQQQDLGISIEQKLVVKAPKIIDGESKLNVLSYFKTQALQNSSIQHLTYSSEVPGRSIFWGDEFKRLHDTENSYKGYAILSIDEDFISSFNIPLLAGRNFIKDQTSDYQAIIINRKAAQQLGFSNPEDAINEDITKFGQPIRIIGVVEDFHQQSLKKETDPIIFRYIPWANSYFTFSIQGKGVKETVRSVEQLFKQVFPENAFEYFFLDEFYNQQYQAEEYFGKIFILFSGLAIFVACMGLFGLASFATTQRTKEIGVRKVLGASVANILILLNKDFIQLILWANLFTWPLAYWGISKWLENYATRIEISPWLFIVPALLVLSLALLVITLQTLKAARANPVNTLRYE
jgi:putative ABC transport system permease protein